MTGFSIRRLRAITALLALMCLPCAQLAAAPAESALLGRPAPDFALPAVGGANVRLSEYRGDVVIVSFWSSRCSVCAAQLAALDALYDTYRSAGLIVLGVSVDDEPVRARTYAQAHMTRFPLLLDLNKGVSRSYMIDVLPTTALIDRSGTVRYVHPDYRRGDASYVTQIRTLLDDDPGAIIGAATPGTTH